ncbi:MAG: hypothetical protein ABSD10_04120, partial [Candidatus Saccharimonadales bacterium]
MVRQKTRTCVVCNQPFKGRPNAKTCSERCRKRLQRAKTLLAHKQAKITRQKTRTCVVCNQPFKGRPNAKTCSERCRKRLQRAKTLLAHKQ